MTILFKTKITEKIRDFVGFLRNLSKFSSFYFRARKQIQPTISLYRPIISQNRPTMSQNHPTMSQIHPTMSLNQPIISLMCYLKMREILQRLSLLWVSMVMTSSDQWRNMGLKISRLVMKTSVMSLLRHTEFSRECPTLVLYCTEAYQLLTWTTTFQKNYWIALKVVNRGQNAFCEINKFGIFRPSTPG